MPHFGCDLPHHRTWHSRDAVGRFRIVFENDNGKYLMSEKKPTEEAIAKARKLVEKFTVKSGTTTHPDKEVTESVVLGLADNIDTLGKPLCPCRFYPDKK